MGKARGVMSNFRTGLDAMVREAELQEMEKKWAAENDRIMREHPMETAADPEATADAPQMEALDQPATDALKPDDKPAS